MPTNPAPKPVPPSPQPQNTAPRPTFPPNREIREGDRPKRQAMVLARPAMKTVS